jgi:hypothetical protein
MFRAILTFLSAILMILALAFGVLAFLRSKLPYDSSGIFFDEESGTTFDADAIVSFTFISIVSALLCVGGFFWRRKLTR